MRNHTWIKSAPDSPFARLPRGAAKTAAATEGMSTRYIKMAWRIEQVAPDLVDSVIAGEISLVAANRALRDRMRRASRLQGIIREGFSAEQKHDLARKAEVAAPDFPARVRRWWLAVLAVVAIPAETTINEVNMKSDGALLEAQAAIGAAIHGFDPVSQ